jgi:undecaprenyl-diphosphatase
MSLLQSIIMGLIQGLTEFLPVSSSGHLAIFQTIFHVNTDTGLLFDVLLHMGTLIAIFAVYYKDIWEMIKEGIAIVIDICVNLGIFVSNLFSRDKKEYRSMVDTSYRKFVILILISTIPTGIIGILASDLIEAASQTLIVPGTCLIITGILLFISDRLPNGERTPKTTSYGQSLFIGITQGFATLPGLSRSGTTITACLLCGFDRKYAVKYSFIMSIPAVLGAAVLELKDISAADLAPNVIQNYVVGMVVAAVVGYICIKTMLVIVRQKKFTIFALYCLIVGVVALAAGCMGLA